ncbi:Asp23/Gls24 family envelope stress response protein [Actinomadura montaniterrae]|uniref:Asp23/Gls24 family envelope stress response protein n=1 Tax=Actinomadura montaniterrae TaxID=1803903 RepID=A0A6L3VIZ4_9ACTN|nr:Asp23/Gls24 family envelope stress response protein [Actinomadura montaniterrae]
MSINRTLPTHRGDTVSQDEGRRDGSVATQDRPEEGLRRARAGGVSELVTSGGRTEIADVVVAKIASMAAREVGGVHEMGAGMSRTIGSVKERLPGVAADPTQGVGVQVGERQAAIDIDLVVDYGASIPDLANAVRSNVIGQVEHMCGLEVVEVDITVDDIHLPDDDREESEQPTGPRVL